MMAIKCNNCKANIPDGATFCPNCGTSRNVQHQSVQTYQPQQMMYRGSSPLEGVFDMVFSKTAVIIGVSIGILLAWIGLLIIIFATGNSKAATLIASIGFAGIGLLLIGGGVWNNRIDKFVRLAMVLIGVWAIVQTMSIVNLSFTSILGSAFGG